jgi:SNF2 family DNA or RNA helicase
VLLVTLKAGGLGLNLTAADYVFLLDPWWNPAAEAQAIDRAHRIGQTRPVFAYRMVARGTVEERVLALQREKRAVAQELVPEGTSRLGTLTVDDLRQLLDG